jgi:segregation and condensation protein A
MSWFLFQNVDVANMHLRLENFDGPLDLLLHLIKAQEINIFNIPIFLITEQFLNFLRQVPTLDYLNAGDYLAMASQLIEIKANLLIPVLQKQNVEDAQSMEDVAEDDPRKPLVAQLLEYESLKRASELLQSMAALQKEIFPSGEFKRREEEFSSFEHPIQGNAFDLVIAFEKALLKFSTKKSIPRITVKAHKITIHQKMISIKKKMELVEMIVLTDLMQDCASRYELIVSIMAVLELCKANHLCVDQDELFGEIRITRGRLFENTVQELEAA